jgi:hypothetical protein
MCAWRENQRVHQSRALRHIIKRDYFERDDVTVVHGDLGESV